jgi:ABC-type glycerol-3-phosphate transport system permease component
MSQFTRVVTLFSSSEEELTPAAAMRNIGVTAFISLTLFVIVFPLYWTLNTSFKTAQNAQTAPPAFLPDPVSLSGYIAVFTGEYFGTLVNSIVISVGATVLAMLIGVPAGYAYARGPEKIGGKNTAFWILSIRMFPPIAPILPLFFIFNFLGLVDTYLVMMLLYLTINVPLVVWLMRSFFRDIPEAVEEAALIDGYSRFQAFFRVMLPIVMPGLVSTVLLAWVFAWNEFQFALVFTRSSASTYPVTIPEIMSGHQSAWHIAAAMSTLAMLPVIAISLLMQKRLIRGLTLGAVKG